MRYDETFMFEGCLRGYGKSIMKFLSPEEFGDPFMVEIHRERLCYNFQPSCSAFDRFARGQCIYATKKARIEQPDSLLADSLLSLHFRLSFSRQSVVAKDARYRQAPQSGFLSFCLDSSGIHSRQTREVCPKKITSA